jgi:hypothetical protein
MKTTGQKEKERQAMANHMKQQGTLPYKLWFDSEEYK